MLNQKIIKGLFSIICLTLLVSCDKDFNTIGVDVVGNNHFNLLVSRESTVKTYSLETGAVQSNNLAINALGIYENPVFGKTTANFVTQVDLAVVNPTFTTINNAPTIVSVKLKIPYFNTKTDTDADGAGTYRLDSIYGDSEFKLKVFENGFYIRDLDPSVNFTESQKYYTNQNSEFETYKGQQLNDATEVVQNSEFFFDKSEKVVEELDEDGVVTKTTRFAPSMELDLNINFFKTKILEAPTGKLESSNIFKNYFRGLYFQVEQIAGKPGSMMMLDFSKGTITVTYEEDKENSEGVVERPEKTLTINLSGNSVSLQNFQPTPTYTNGLLATLNPTYGQEKLFLKGGEGSFAVIELFGSADVDMNGVADELDYLRSEEWLINEANLVFYVDKTSMSGAREPNRVYLYDLNNKRPIIDYYIDGNVNAIYPKFNKAVHGGILETEETDDKRGIKYKLRLTNHISNLIKKDSTNVKLGLVVTESISNITAAKLKNAIVTPNVKTIPTASVMNPLGTILYGSSPNIVNEKRLKLEIYYTKPN